MTQKQIERVGGYSIWKLVVLGFLLIFSLYVITTNWNNFLKETIVLICWLLLILIGSLNTIQEDINGAK